MSFRAPLLASPRSMRPELRYAVRSSLTVLSLLRPVRGMPEPEPLRGRVAELLRRRLAGAESCRVVDREEAERLEGFVAEPVGLELEPPGELFVLPEERARLIEHVRRVRVELSAELPSAGGTVLVPFSP